MLFITSTLVVLSVICTLAQGCTDDWDHVIYVDYTSTDTATCGHIAHPCGTFDTALNKLTSNYTAICLRPGTYNLTNGSHTQLLYKSNVAIIGSSEDTVVIQCSPLTGLYFFRSTNITLQFLTLLECGGVQVSTSRQEMVGFLKFQVSVYMLYCEDVLIDNVAIESSNGTGLTLYNTVGTVTIRYCAFKYNGVSLDKSGTGGGGLQIEFTDCIPGDDGDCKDGVVSYSSNALYNITTNVFIGNTAKYRYDVSTLDDDDISLGKGGGVSIIFKGYSNNNVIYLQYTNITNNMAHQGGGVYLALYNEPQTNINIHNLNILNNTCYNNIVDSMAAQGGGAIFSKLCNTLGDNAIAVSKSMINYNEAPIGGGIFIVYSGGFYSRTTCNITIVDTDFHCNSAQHGAAMYLQVYDYPYNHDDPLVLHVLLLNLNLTNNHGVKLLPSSSYYTSCTGIICIDNLLVMFSGIMELNDNNASSIELHNYASLELLSSSHCSFYNNKGEKGGAIALYNCSYVVLHDDVTLVFNSNTANVGGAIYSSECFSVCFIQYYQAHVDYEKWNVSLSFSDNSAHMYGNAMYTYVSSTVNCWPPYADCSTPRPRGNADYNISNMFCWTNWHYSPGDCRDNVNTSMQSYSVYPGDTVNLEHELKILSASTKLTYYEICINGPASFNDTANYNGIDCGCSVEFYDVDNCYCPEPERCKTFSHHDIHVALSFSLYFAPQATKRTNCIDESNNALTLHVQAGCNNSLAFNIMVISVQFKPCPSSFNNGPFCNDTIRPCDNCGWSYHTQCFVIESESHLECTGDQSFDGSMLNSEGTALVPLCGIGATVRPKDGYCLFQYNNSNNNSNIGIGTCPLGFGNLALREKYSTLVQRDLIQSDDHFCSDTSDSTPGNLLTLDWLWSLSHRAGILCGKCPNGYISVSDVTLVSCIDIDESELDLPAARYMNYSIIAEFILVTIMIVIIIVLDIKLVGGHITGYVLYCQIMSLQIASVNEAYLNIRLIVQYYTSPILSLWNLNFMHPLAVVHVTHTMDALGAISFWYIIAFYPLVLLLLLYIWIVMYERGWRMVVCITRPVHRLLARFWLKFDIHPSLIDSIAGIYTLCFAQLSVISLKILQYGKWESLTSDESGLAFYYDGSLPYFGWPYHCLAGSFAIFVLIAFVAIPTIYLLLYPFKLFQKFLDVFKIRRQLTDAIVDSLTGSFKDGLDNNYDFRFFAGLYLLLRVGIICLHYIPDSDYFIYSYIGLLLLAGGTVSIFRPFKRSIHNFSNFTLIMLLTASAVYAIIVHVSDYPLFGFTIVPGIVFNLPGLVVFGYCIYKIIKVCCCKCKCRRHNAPAIDDDEHSPLLQQQPNINFSINDNFDADRMMNPDNYDERHFSNPWLQAQLGSNATGGSVQGGTNSGYSALCQPTADEDHSSCSTEGDEDD